MNAYQQLEEAFKNVGNEEASKDNFRHKTYLHDAVFKLALWLLRERKGSPWYLKRMKHELQSFDMRTGCWRNDN